MDNTTYMIWDTSTETIIARDMPRDNALDLLGMLMTWNKGIQAWRVQVDYCEEANCVQDDSDNNDTSLTNTITWDEEQQAWRQSAATLLAKQVADIKKGIAGLVELRDVGSTSNKSKVVDEKKATAEK